jgi:hypothetical protein
MTRFFQKNLRPAASDFSSMRTFSIFLLFAILPLSLWYSFPAIGKTLNEDKEMVATMVLEQTHRPIGKLEVAITKTALKVSFPDYGTDLLASAPDWHVTYYNPVSRMVHTMTYVRFSSFGTSLSACAEYPEFDKGKSTSTLVAGVKANCYKTKDKSGETTEVCVYPATDINPKIIAILAKLDRLPNLGGLPLCAHIDSQTHEKAGVNAWLPRQEFDGKNHRYHRLQTLSIKHAQRSASDFKYPLGFKETADESAISFGHRADGLIDFLTGDGKSKSFAKPINETKR